MEVMELRECPSCGESAEPEQDGDVSFYVCGCGMEFGYTVVSEDPSCQLGIPEEVRRGGTIPAGIAGSHDHPPVFLGQVGRQPDVS